MKRKSVKENDPPINYKILENVDVSQFKTFSQFPLSKQTLKGLAAGGFVKITDIQKHVLRHALLNKDIVAEAPTGSGKTLAFLVPILEILHSDQVSMLDGPVAIILTPTRELARQIFEVVRKIMTKFRFTVLNIMGGKTAALKKTEWMSVQRANILIGTPGRFAQHQTENSYLDTSNLRLLILDEADRLLDSTFRGDLEVIVQNLSSNRQTMLFSATLNKATNELVRLSMKNPITISLKSQSDGRVPSELTQSYAIVPLESKLDILWTFLQSHCKKKIIVFFSTQKQVRYVCELFHHLRPFYKVFQLRGNMNQQKRFIVYDRFSQCPHGAILFATNVAERGLDFPGVDWVVQMDCPHEIDDYIHRVGRTARFGKGGRSILFLLPSETNLVTLLEQKSIYLKLQKFPDNKIQRFVSTRAPIALVCKLDMASSARLAFSAYVRDYCLIARHSQTKTHLPSVFDPTKLNVVDFARSLGLPQVPTLPKEFLQFVPEAEKLYSSSFETVQLPPVAKRPRLDGECLTLKPLDVVDDSSSSESEGGELFVRKLTSNSVEDQVTPVDTSSTIELSGRKKRDMTRIQLAKKMLKQKVREHKKIEYDELGNVICRKIGNIPIVNDWAIQDEQERQPSSCLNVEKERQMLHEVIDKEDKKRWKMLFQEKHRMKKAKLKLKQQKLDQNHGVLLDASDVSKCSDDEDEE